MNKIETTLAAINGGDDFGLLVGKDLIYAYANGKKQDTSIGTKLVVTLQNARMVQLSVKFDHDPLPKISDEEIAQATSNLKYLYVRLPDAVVALFSGPNSNGIGMTATAKTAQIVSINNETK